MRSISRTHTLLDARNDTKRNATQRNAKKKKNRTVKRTGSILTLGAVALAFYSVLGINLFNSEQVGWARACVRACVRAKRYFDFWLFLPLYRRFGSCGWWCLSSPSLLGGVIVRPFFCGTLSPVAGLVFLSLDREV